MQSQRQKKWFRRMLFLGIGLFLAYLYGCFRLAEGIISPKRSVAVRPVGLVERDLVVGSPAWVSPDLDRYEKVFIFSHGLGANRAFFAETALQLQKRGYGVVLTAMPGQDASKEKSIGFGTSESRVIRDTLDQLKARRIVLVGCSMGGAATWMASDHPKVSGVVTECAFSRLEPITKNWLRAKITGGDILFAPVIWIATWKLGLKASEVNPVETAAKWDRNKPALVIAAENDALIPRSQSEELVKASGATLWVVPNVEHAHCQEVGNEFIENLETVMKAAK
jgi:pimeloyl-ACP methyl ester carboxylesterase